MQSTILFLEKPSISDNVSGVSNALIAIMIFSLTVPMTKMALPVFPPEIIALLRAAIAGACSFTLILSLGWRTPTLRELKGLIIGGACVSLAYPYALAHALSDWSASNMGVLLAAIPLVTAVLAACIFKEKHPLLFWVSVFAGTAVLLHFTWQKSSGSLHVSVFIMLFTAAIGYSAGGHVAKTLGGWQTICWMTALYLPISGIALVYFCTQGAFVLQVNWENIEGILAIAYLAFISQWLGFRFWYDAMTKVGIARAGQVQLLQPFFTLIFSVPLLGAHLEVNHFVYALIISVTVVFAVRYKKGEKSAQ